MGIRPWAALEQRNQNFEVKANRLFVSYRSSLGPSKTDANTCAPFHPIGEVMRSSRPVHRRSAAMNLYWLARWIFSATSCNNPAGRTGPPIRNSAEGMRYCRSLTRYPDLPVVVQLTTQAQFSPEIVVHKILPGGCVRGAVKLGRRPHGYDCLSGFVGIGLRSAARMCARVIWVPHPGDVGQDATDLAQLPPVR